jgi:hypothetical protein
LTIVAADDHDPEFDKAIQYALENPIVVENLESPEKGPLGPARTRPKRSA